MEPSIYKPSIYNGAGIYKTGASGGGSGNTGTIFEVDFQNYTQSTITTPCIFPNVGNPFWFSKTFNGQLTSEGLELTSTSGSSQFINLFGFNGKKIRFYQKTKGILVSGSTPWSRAGLYYCEYSSDYGNDRGFGGPIPSNVLEAGTLKNGFSANWGFTEANEPASTMLIVPPIRLTPITDKTLEIEIEFDTENRAISYKINNIIAFECYGIADTLFYTFLQECSRFYLGESACRVAIQRIKIDCYD